MALPAAHDDLIAPFERALTPLRRDGADALDPRAKVWKWQKDFLAGTFDLWLRTDPDRSGAWLVATVGLWTEPQFLDQEPAARLGHFDFTPHHPLLFLPPSAGPGDVHRRVTSGSFPSKDSPWATKAADALGAAHQWSANDPVVLADRVVRDLKLLWPHLTGPGGADEGTERFLRPRMTDTHPDRGPSEHGWLRTRKTPDAPPWPRPWCRCCGGPAPRTRAATAAG
ncbi:hypothetical protein ABZY44_14185 [Streptomyces sp. NPDC006544]|uniref:hypothetical protein n=1 Tax=Streptomyces sp. NPDC006544 TaxID=3154583 RepID=UPI0033B8444B